MLNKVEDRDVTTVEEHFIMDGSTTLAVADAGGNVQYWNMYGNQLLGRQKANGQQLFYVADYLGSTRRVYNENNQDVAAYNYYPFGAVMYSSLSEETKETFTGKERDTETGRYYFGARYYDAALGRWSVTDPAGQFASPYAFSANNPHMLVDRDGQLAWFVPVLIGATLGGYSGYKVGESRGAKGWELVGYTFGGAAIGAASGYIGYGISSGLTTGILSGGGSAFEASVFSSTIGSAVSSGFSNASNQLLFNGSLNVDQLYESVLYGFGGGLTSGAVNGSPISDLDFPLHHSVKHSLRSTAYTLGGSLFTNERLNNVDYGLNISGSIPLLADIGNLTNDIWGERVSEAINRKVNDRIPEESNFEIDLTDFRLKDLQVNRVGTLLFRAEVPSSFKIRIGNYSPTLHSGHGAFDILLPVSMVHKSFLGINFHSLNQVWMNNYYRY